MKWYKRDPDAALGGMSVLTLEERGAYNGLLDVLYSCDGIVPDVDEDVARMLTIDVRVWRRLKAQLMARGKVWVEDGMLQAKRVEATLAEAGALSEKQRHLSHLRWEQFRKSKKIKAASMPAGMKPAPDDGSGQDHGKITDTSIGKYPGSVQDVRPDLSGNANEINESPVPAGNPSTTTLTKEMGRIDGVSEPRPEPPTPPPVNPTSSTSKPAKQRAMPLPPIEPEMVFRAAGDLASDPEIVEWAKVHAPLVADQLAGELARYQHWQVQNGEVHKRQRIGFRNWLAKAQQYAKRDGPAAAAGGAVNGQRYQSNGRGPFTGTPDKSETEARRMLDRWLKDDYWPSREVEIGYSGWSRYFPENIIKEYRDRLIAKGVKVR